MTWTSRTPARSRAATAAVVVAVNTSGTRFTPGILRTIASRRMTGVATIAIFLDLVGDLTLVSRPALEKLLRL